MIRSHLDALLTALDGRPRPQQLRQLGDVGSDAPPARHVLGVLSARMRKSFSS
jgi:hypothetical protein